MKYYKKLVGDRIYLSPMCIEDAEKYVEWFCDFKMTDGIKKSSSLMTVESEREWIEGSLKENRLNFVIVRLEDDKVIGNCGIMNVNQKDRCGEVGIFIGGEENRSKGYGTETLKLLLDFGFNYQNLNNITLGVMSFNERAINCYKKIGFKEIGRRRECYFLNGKYYDEIYMDILAREFKGDYIRNKNI
ncbi:MAG: GNAT family N-acetyltransferase [Clostridia bacterium]|nr:GNAT family N-acetyltransferase [Clostridia bacterium]